jgi:cobalt-zinc-cadmium efflux system outer membrane protein
MLPRISRAVAGLVVACVATRPVTTRADERAFVVSLDEATFLKKVHERSPRRQVLEERQRAARAQIGVAGQLPNPTLSYEREAVPGLDVSDTYLRLGWMIDLAGRRGLATSAARAGADAERLDVDREVHVLEIDARLAYLDAVYARAHVARLDEDRATLLQLVDALRSRAKQGDASSYDADRATLQLDALDDERATARRQLETARLRLGALMGEPAVPYDASGALALPARPDTSQLSPQRPDVEAALARAAQADRELRAARRRWVPRLEIVVGMRASSSTDGDGVGYVGGIGGDLPLFDRGGAAGDRARADAKRWRAEATALANDARAEGEQARRELVLRIEQAEAYLAGPATRASDLQRRATVAYREGDRPILELLDVQRTARHAAGRALELIYEARRAELTLRRALGRDR